MGLSQTCGDRRSPESFRETFRDFQRREENGDFQRLSETFRDFQRLSETFRDFRRLAESIRDFEVQDAVIRYVFRTSAHIGMQPEIQCRVSLIHVRCSVGSGEKCRWKAHGSDITVGWVAFAAALGSRVISDRSWGGDASSWSGVVPWQYGLLNCI